MFTVPVSLLYSVVNKTYYYYCIFIITSRRTKQPRLGSFHGLHENSEGIRTHDATLFKSLFCSNDAIWRLRTPWVNIGSYNGLLPDGTKTLPGPMLHPKINVLLVEIMREKDEVADTKKYKWQYPYWKKREFDRKIEIWIGDSKVTVVCVMILVPSFKSNDDPINWRIFASLGCYGCNGNISN